MKFSSISRLLAALYLPLAAVQVACAGDVSSMEQVDEEESALATSWASGPAMNAARAQHTVTRLNDGRLLIAGGISGGSALASVDICDAAGTSCTAAASMPNARYDHVAALLSNGKVLVAGGNSGSGSIAAADLFDPSTNQWSAVASMNKVRSNAAAAVLTDGKILVAGGVNANNSAVASGQIDVAAAFKIAVMVAW